VKFRNRSQTVREQRMLGILGEGDRERFAAGRGPCVVAMHGFGGTAAELAPLLDRVAQDGYALDAALLPGHGTAVEQLQDATFDGWVAAVRARSEAAAGRQGRVVLLGFSLGSLVAMQIASEKPPWLAGLVALGNAVTLKPHTSVPLGLWRLTGRPMPDMYLLKPRAGDLVDQSVQDALFTYDRHPIRAALEVYLAGPRVREVVRDIACPTLILHGKRDGVCSWRNATWLAEHIGSRDVTVRIFERSAHVLCCDAERDEVGREVAAFLGRL
jgi:carboxylesterase